MDDDKRYSQRAPDSPDQEEFDEEFERKVEALRRGANVEGLILDPMNDADPEAIPKIVRGMRERRHHIYWHSWIADTRPDGLGISRALPFNNHMRFFVTDAGDERRTNMHCAGQLAGDRSFLVRRVGIHASFSDKRHYAAFFRSCRLSFNVGDKWMLVLPASYFSAEEHRIDPLELNDKELRDPPQFSYDGGYCGFLDLTRNIAIPSRQGFDWVMDCHDENFVRDMQLIETGAYFASYAEITLMIEGEETLEIL
jgi:hypothetical protein